MLGNSHIRESLFETLVAEGWWWVSHGGSLPIVRMLSLAPPASPNRGLTHGSGVQNRGGGRHRVPWVSESVYFDMTRYLHRAEPEVKNDLEGHLNLEVHSVYDGG